MKFKVNYIYEMYHSYSRITSLLLVTYTNDKMFSGDDIGSQRADGKWHLAYADLKDIWIPKEIGHVEDHPEYIL